MDISAGKIKRMDFSPPVSPDFSPPVSPISLISPPEPWPEQQKPYITEGMPQYYKKKSPKLKSLIPKKSIKPKFSLELSPLPKSAKRSPRKVDAKRSPRKSKNIYPDQKILVPVPLPKPGPKPSAPPLEELTLAEFLSNKGVKPLEVKADNLVKRKESLKAFFSDENIICSMFRNGELKFGRYIKSGVNGDVMELSFSNKKGKYVVKSEKKPISPTCIQDKSITYYRTDGKGTVTFPEGSVLCTQAVSEFLLSLITGNLKKQSKSQNFIETSYMASCYSNGTIQNQYTLMEQIAGDMSNLLKERKTASEVDSIYIQILHAIYMLQKLGIVHGDLHTGNVFYENSSASPKLDSAKYFCYKVGEKYLKFPGCPYIVKVGDLGMAVKYSKPAIGNINVAAGNYGNVMPNFYTEAYDVAYITCILHAMIPGSELIKRAFAKIMKCKESEIQTVAPKCFDLKTYRPFADALTDPSRLEGASAKSLLLDESVMKKYLTKDRPSDCARLDMPID